MFRGPENPIEYYDRFHKRRMNDGRIDGSDLKTNLAFLENQGIGPNDRILEIGCGLGLLAREIGKWGLSVDALDISWVALQYSRRRHSDSRFLQADGQSLPFKDASFDVILSFDTLEHIINLEAHIAESRRVLKKGGRYFFRTPNLLGSWLWEILKEGAVFEQLVYHPSVQSFWGLRSVFEQGGFTLDFARKPFVSEVMQRKIRKVFGPLATLVESIDWSHCPDFIYPVFYGVAKKTDAEF